MSRVKAKGGQEPLAGSMSEGREGMAALESELPRPGWESPVPSVPLDSDNSESKNGKKR